MAKLFKAVVILLFILASSLFIYSKAFAIDQDLTYWINGYDIGQNPYQWADPSLDFKFLDGRYGLRIDGTVRTVVVSFVGLEHSDKDVDGNKEYYVCGQRDEKNCRFSEKSGTQKRFRTNTRGEIHIEVCGAGVDWLKGVKVNNPTDRNHINEDYIEVKEGCKEKKDYFHEGEVYRLWLYQDKEAENLITVAELFVKHSYPVVKIEPVGDNVFNALRPIKVSLWGRRPGGNNENNYQVVLEGTNNGTKIEKCTTVPKGGTTEPGKNPPGDTVGINTQGIDLDTQKVISEHMFSGTGHEVAGSGKGAEVLLEKGKGGGPGQGAFVLKINERKHDNRPLGIAESCNGGHSYLYIYFRLVKPDNKFPRGIDIYRVMYDPNNADWEDISEKLLDQQFEAPPLPCADGGYDFENNTCNKINTALGEIEVTAPGFIKTMFRFILVLAAFGSILIIIYSGYTLITSAGNKEKIAAARETITSAVVGLLFIIFSIVILEIIGVDILRIPGLTR